MRDEIEPRASAFPLRCGQVQANGESFHVIEQGEGPAVLFCHGFPDTAETWRSQMGAVAEDGYHAGRAGPCAASGRATRHPK